MHITELGSHKDKSVLSWYQGPAMQQFSALTSQVKTLHHNLDALQDRLDDVDDTCCVRFRDLWNEV